MSKVIPKEQLTAYQRWELAVIEDDNVPRAPTARDRHRAAGDRTLPQVVLPTAEDVERLHQEAWQEGYNLGLDEGRKAGYESGREAVEQHVRQLQALAEVLELGRIRQDEAVAQEVLNLALTVAQQMVRNALRIKPELILDALRDALLSLPALNGHHKIFTHPQSVDTVREWLAHEHGHLSWKVLEDPEMEFGGFRFETVYSELDGSLKVRWREINDCLGASNEWLS